MDSIGSIASDSSSLQMNYLNLLVSQLRYQNPLDPVSNTEFTAQLAQLSQLEQLEKLNSSFAKVLGAQQLAQSAGLIGREIAFMPPGSLEAQTGRVDRIDLLGDELRIVVGRHELALSDVLSVGN